ncbi:phytoene desaturase family protein [Bacteroidota bacterium]
MGYDVIVIGGGLGGLTAGAKLAKEGRRVLLIEQHDRPGGCATTFKRKDFTMEVGLHEMDGLHPRDMKTRIFRDLGVFDEVTFLKVPEFYRFVNGRYDFVMPHDPELAIDSLIGEFPSEEEGIRAFFERIMNAREYIKKSAGDAEGNVGEYLDSIIRDEDLKLILLGNLGYFHDDPYTLSLNYYAIAQGSYYAGGGNFIQGGSQVLSNFLARSIEKQGGKVLLKHMVTDILLEGEQVVGVEYCVAGKGDQSTLQALGKDIILNASIPSLLNFSLPEDYLVGLKKDLTAREIGASLLTVYFGFNKSLKEIGSGNYSYFLYDPSVSGQPDIKSNNCGAFEERSFTFVDYGQVDSRMAPEGKSVGAVCCIDYPDQWEGLSKENYRQKKEDVAQVFIGRLEAFLPGFRNAVEFYEVGTSLTVERYTLNPKGAVYGFTQSPERVVLDEISTLPGLHFASAWSKIGGGFSGAIFNGYMCAIKILRG